MDDLLYDELLQDIMQRLPTSDSSNVSLVNKRWLHLHRTSRISLSLKLINTDKYLDEFSSFLFKYPFVVSLSIFSDTCSNNSVSSDTLLSCVSEYSSKYLRTLKFFAGPVSGSAIGTLSESSAKGLTSLRLSVSGCTGLSWVVLFPSLKELCVEFSPTGKRGFNGMKADESFKELPLESLSLSGIEVGDWGLGWLWRSCVKLRHLKLKSCDGTGDGVSSIEFASCMKRVEELELRSCRCIIDVVLLQLEDNCDALKSLLVYDGGSRSGLSRFIIRSKGKLQLRKLDIRLPLDLDNNHLIAMAFSFNALVSLKLQSCCLFTGEGLMAVGLAMSNTLEELSLINCDVVDREPGLLTTLCQNLRGLKKLDLSYNEMLLDKTFVSMIVSLGKMVDIRLRGCRRLTKIAMVMMVKICKSLEYVDVRQCWGIGEAGVEVLVVNSVKRIEVDEGMVSSIAKSWASQRFIEVVS